MHFSCMTICVWIVFESKVEKNLKMIALLKSVEGQASCTDECCLCLLLFLYFPAPGGLEIKMAASRITKSRDINEIFSNSESENESDSELKIYIKQTKIDDDSESNMEVLDDEELSHPLVRAEM